MASTPPLPPLTPPAGTLHTPTQIPKTKHACSGCGNRLVTGLFPPVYYHCCRNNQELILGFACLHRTEMQLINLLHEHGQVSTCLAYVKHELNEARMRALNVDVEHGMRLTEGPVAPRSPLAIESADDFSSGNDLSSGDEF
ncbi:unnamed protein product [Phytophthora fragariaefolia]|uniref:Unnamed protein product n=1 Tax=Phytophthora fragariaefolia TaxID=1490495 RepID=A0A9W6XPQ2_9STRA|nr:unnamed protein product [Phytophthora fragariaefolia]